MMNPTQSPNAGVGRELSSQIAIPCIGVDRVLHICAPHEKLTKCGKVILSKKITRQEVAGLFSCYECTY